VEETDSQLRTLGKPIREVEVSGATNINYKKKYIIFFGKLSIKRYNSLYIA
jgi:hypothetical protein